MLSHLLPRLTLRRILVIPVAYALVFGLFRGVGGPLTFDEVVSGLVGGTGLAGLGLAARTRGQWMGAAVAIVAGGFLVPLYLGLCCGWTEYTINVALLVGVATCVAVRRSFDNPRPQLPSGIDPRPPAHGVGSGEEGDRHWQEKSVHK